MYFINLALEDDETFLHYYELMDEDSKNDLKEEYIERWYNKNKVK